MLKISRDDITYCTLPLYHTAGGRSRFGLDYVFALVSFYLCRNFGSGPSYSWRVDGCHQKEIFRIKILGGLREVQVHGKHRYTVKARIRRGIFLECSFLAPVSPCEVSILHFVCEGYRLLATLGGLEFCLDESIALCSVSQHCVKSSIHRLPSTLVKFADTS